MSFAYLPLYTGDYLRDTRHLSPLRHGVYLLLLMHCWDQKGPVPLDEQEAAGIANCRSTDEVEALRYVLNRYFVQMDDGWYNKRIEEEIERSNVVSHKRSDAANARWKARRIIKAINDAAHDASALQEQIVCNASDMQDHHPIPIPIPNQKPKSKTTTRTPSAATLVLPDHIDPKIWEGYLEVRKAKRAPKTDLALTGILSDLEQFRAAGYDPNAVLMESVKRGWVGVFEPKDRKGKADPFDGPNLVSFV